MSANKNSLHLIESTGFRALPSYDGTGNYSLYDQLKLATAVILGSVVLCGSLQSHFQKESLYSKEQIADKVSLFNLNNYKIVSLKEQEQLLLIKECMGLNISELAAILFVSRPTIYEWLDSNELNMRKKHKDRLDSIYQISNLWSEKKIGRIGSYLHNFKINNNDSLFNLLQKDIINQNLVKDYLEQIASLIRNKKQRDEMYEQLLKNHGFEPISKEARDDRLDDISFLD